MRILLLSHSFNSLTQRLWVELSARGHWVAVEFDVNDSVTTEAVELAKPDLIVAPFLKRAIPEQVWQNHVCLVVHPGPVGDRGPSALDWAILEGEQTWGVTVLQAVSDMDAGPVWAHRTFPMRAATKSSIYRNEVTEAAVEAVLEAVESRPAPFLPQRSWWKPVMRQTERAIDWAKDDTRTVLRKLRSADGTPGVLDGAVFLHDGHDAPGLSGQPGAWIARQGDRLARATTNGAVWIGQIRPNQPGGLKLPAARVLPDLVGTLPDSPGHHDIWYDEKGGVGFLHFPFHNGAFSTDQCRRLEAAFRDAASRPTKVIALMGGPDFWSNGIHLSTIEAAESPADESWANINAMNDLTKAVIECTSHLTVAAMHGNAGAGGVFMALAADIVWARTGVVLNPHYKGMGNLFGSEYWTYLLPRRCGEQAARAVTQARLPVGTGEAVELGLIDDFFSLTPSQFRADVEARAIALAADPQLEDRLAAKRLSRLADEAEKPLQQYRTEELEHMKLNFYGFDPSYHVARYNFIRKVPKSRTPLYLARHRTKG
jgi:putative two-component system hydrogenase maturation factor HypX/HoxX